MSVNCIQVEDIEVTETNRLYGAKEFVLVNRSPETRNLLPFPSDYNFAPCFLPKKYERYADRIQHFKVRPDDIWILTYPKSGTTWIMNIAWQLKNNLDFSAAYLHAGYMYLEHGVAYDENEENKGNEVYNLFVKNSEALLDEIENEPSPRLIKSHLPAHLLPKDIWTVKPKLIYMDRDVKDVAISMYHMFRDFAFLNYQGSMENFFDDFMNDRVLYASFMTHMNGFRKLNELDHILLLNYDELVIDQFSGIQKICEFLGYKYTDDQMKQLTQHVSFENMSNKPSVNSPKYSFNFFRKGKSGAYRDEMSSRYIQIFDKWEEENRN